LLQNQIKVRILNLLLKSLYPQCLMRRVLRVWSQRLNY